MKKEITPLCIRLSSNITKSNENQYKEVFETMFYDPIDGINKINKNNKNIPAVLYCPLMGTLTSTKVNSENTDDDDQRFSESLLGTKTHTEVKSEITDDDPAIFASLDTMTQTSVQIESFDQDPDDNYT